MEELARREAARARAGQGHRLVRRSGYGRGAPPGRTSARRDRRPAHGRDERRRGSVRLRQDVPAAGRKERPRDEEGRGLPDPFIEEKGGEARKSNGTVVMATVKGDVHDIGKNIVGVVLQCNNFEVIDLGVMAPSAKILQTAREKNADAIGLSGLITPSLEEMVHNAKEMQREGFEIPLLIGGATTSQTHTAVKIAPGYEQPVIHVKDASRAVGVVQKLVSEDHKAGYAEQVAADYERVRRKHAGRRSKTRLTSLEKARANGTKIDWNGYNPPKPNVLGVRTFDDYALQEIRPFIDWTPFFHSWQLKGSHPGILDDPEKGEEARKLFADAQGLLENIIAEKWLKARD